MEITLFESRICKFIFSEYQMNFFFALFSWKKHKFFCEGLRIAKKQKKKIISMVFHYLQQTGKMVFPYGDRCWGRNVLAWRVHILGFEFQFDWISMESFILRHFNGRFWDFFVCKFKDFDGRTLKNFWFLEIRWFSSCFRFDLSC